MGFSGGNFKKFSFRSGILQILRISSPRQIDLSLQTGKKEGAHFFSNRPELPRKGCSNTCHNTIKFYFSL